MKRRVVRHGLSTYIVSLPSGWAKKYNINKGDELDVEERENTLLVTTGKSKRFDAVEVDITGLDRASIMYLIRSLYKLGYDEIKLTFKEQTTKHYRTGQTRTIVSIIHEEINRLIGFEVMQQRENFVVLKSLSEVSAQEFESALRRAFLLTVDMSDDLIKGAESKDEALLQTLEEKHNTITKFLSLCMRLLNKRGHDDPRKTLMLFSVLVMLDKLVDTIKNTSRILIQLKPDISPEAKKLMLKAHTAVELYYHTYYAFDNKKVRQLSELRDTTLKDLLQKTEKLSKKELVVVTTLVSSIELITAMAESSLALQH